MVFGGKLHNTFTLLALLFISTVHAQSADGPQADVSETGNTEIYEGFVRTMGIGPGTFAVMIAAFIGIIICFFKEACARPTCCVCIGFLLPVIAFLVVYSLPVKSV